ADLAGANRGFRIDTNMEAASVKALDRTSNAAAPHAFDQIEPGIERLLAAARDRVVITNPYIVLSERVRRALAAAGRRGVRITILTDSPTTADNPLYAAFFMREWPRLLARVPNLRVFVLTGDQRMHAKTLVADGEVGLIGSSNMDLLSAEVNGEIMEAIHSRAAARRLEAQFERDRRDPRNGVVEYTIRRDRRGRPVLRDGQPVVTFGPEHHVASGRLRAQEAIWKPLSRWIETWPQAQSLRGPEAR
ncbi:MAG TPA: phospholipase D-like domain-containing protein, partial [Myxococcota bacterium]|nr:phospholipase D-like domain-containing protein [Myxococcota bacterium]